MFANEPGSDTADNNCLACRSADMVFNQPALWKMGWKAEVEDKMRTAYKAPMDPKDVNSIINLYSGQHPGHEVTSHATGAMNQ